MQIKVSIKYSIWPYEEETSVTIPLEDIPNGLDKPLDALLSNAKMRIFSVVRAEHPLAWHTPSPLDIDKLDNLKTNASTN